jgi:hypothetical protein
MNTRTLAAQISAAIGNTVEIYLAPAATHLFIHAADVATLHAALVTLPSSLGFSIAVDRVLSDLETHTPYAMVGVLKHGESIIPSQEDMEADLYTESVIDAAGDF